jgi:SAM-dependent methyltransferase
METCSACPICAKSDISIQYWRTPSFSRCKGCGTIFRDPFPSEEQLGELYRSSWSNVDLHVDETGGTNSKLGQIILQKLLRELNVKDFSGQRVLDFGAGRGGMSVALRKMQANVTAIEPFGYNYLRQLKIPVYRDLSQMPVHCEFDGIVMMEVIEHLRNPCDLLSQLYHILRPGGWVLLTTPDPKSLAARLYGQRWSSAANAGHIAFLTGQTLHEVLSRFDFKEIRQTRWVIRFPDVPYHRTIVQSVLQLLRLGGGLRFLAVKADYRVKA